MNLSPPARLTPATPTPDTAPTAVIDAVARGDNPEARKIESYPALDWLRFVLASVVVLGHEGVAMPGPINGGLAVEVFLALSGWLIGGILLRTTPAELPRFFYNRSTRIWAPYLFTATLIYGLAAVRQGIDGNWFKYLFYDLTFTHYTFTTFPRALAEMPLGGTGAHFWSISVEEQFYLAAPLVILFMGKGRSLLTWAAIAAVLLAVQSQFAAIALGVAAAVASWWAFAEPIEQRAVRAGSLLVGLILALTVQSLAPALTPLILFPTLAAAGATVAVRFARHGAWIAAALGVLPLAYLLIFGHSVLLALGVPTPEAIGVFVLFATPIVLPLAGGAPLRFTFAALLTAAALLLSIRATPASPRYPALSQLYGVSDPEGRRWLVSPLERPDPWTMAMLRRDGAVPAKVSMPLVADGSVWRVPARGYAVLSPTIRIAREGEWRRIIVTPGSGGRTMTLSLATDTLLQSLVIGERAVSVPGTDRRRVKVRWQSTGKPLVLRYRSRRGSYLQVVAAETTENRLSLPPRPAAVVGWLGSDRIIAMRTASSRE